MFYVIYHRAKKTGRFKVKPGDSNNTAQTVTDTFQNPIYDVSEVVKQEPTCSHDNPAYQMTDDPDREKNTTPAHTFQNLICDVNTIAQKESLYSHANQAYQRNDDPDKEI